jgi:potassium efflux system protein
MVGFAVFTARLIHPKTGVLSHYLAAKPAGWINRLSPLWYPLIVATPLALAVLALLGYVYTAGTLLRSLVSELWLILGLTVIHQVIVRWLVLTRRRLALRTAVERQTSRTQEAQQTGSDGQTSVLQTDKAEVDLANLDERTRALVNSLVFAAAVVGLWGIYSEVLPALAVFEDISLWSYTGVVDGQKRVIPVTLADIGSTLIITIVATVAAKNLPALLEILLLQRMSISSGSRYTVKTLTVYGIVTSAALMVFSTLGLSWSQVQWLVAALGVGIGFGLQEIVANFISGLIILFERPIRVGDVVTVGDTTGAVSQIQIRATTIRNWDKQELLVPNKELITGRLLNWSLSDQMNRIVITVGVDYDADIPRALELLRTAAEENERILEDPAPLITFEGFGDNSLTLVLRCYLDSLENRLAVTSDLHQSINDKLKSAGISIAFPQRDVHLSTAEPLDVRVHRGNMDT